MSLMEFMMYQKKWRTKGIPLQLTVKEKVKDKIEQEKMEDKLIDDSSSSRLLGVNLQNNLTQESHLSSGKKAILPAVRRQLGMMQKLGKRLGMKAKLQLVNSLAMSKMTYMMCLWGNTTANYIRRAQIVQNTAARFITGRTRTTRQRDKLWMVRHRGINKISLSDSILEDYPLESTCLFRGEDMER